jgi:TolA-binding protein
MTVLQDILRWFRQKSSQNDGADLAGIAAYKFVYEVHSELVGKKYEEAISFFSEYIKQYPQDHHCPRPS